MESNNTSSSCPGKRPKPKLSRTSSKRSHGACLTCKQRHMKCDETRPACARCTRRGINCSGYPQVLKWSYKHERRGSDSSRSQSQSLGAQSPIDAVDQPHRQRQHNQHDQPGATTLNLESDPFSPSCLLDVDMFDCLDGAFGVNGDAGLAASSDFGQYLLDLPLDSVPRLSPGRGSNSSYSWPGSPAALTERRQQDTQRQMMSSIPRELPGGNVDSDMRLIDNWFNEVCPAWSGFDSSMNMSRKLAENLWYNSTAVFKSLQSMSASFLAARLPQMRRPALALLRAATHCIQEEREELNRKTHLDRPPTGVIFALLCVGTTICWLDTRRAGWPFLQDVKRLLGRSLRQDFPISDADASILDYFHKSIVYWDMLISFIYDPEPEGAPDAPLPICLPQHAGIDPCDTTFDTTPHPWTGISTLNCRLLAQSMSICRTYRRRTTQASGVPTIPWPTVREFHEVKRLEELLLQQQFMSQPPTRDTGDRHTSCLHLSYIAEAYQLSSLLQLYITFPDLVSLRLPQESHHSFQRGVPWYKWTVPLTLRLTEVLERVPPNSGSRSLQPLLYICAATGLRYSSSSDVGHESAGGGAPTRPLRPMESILDYLTLLDDPGEGHGADCPSTPQLALDVSNARRFVLRRIGMLKDSLHPGPVRVAEDLVKAIWAVYDEDPQGSSGVSWIDIMERQDYRTLFR